jgi:hypothetical protein
MQHEPPDRHSSRQISPARRLTLEHERRDEQVRCADCKTPVFRAFGDHVALRAWILEYRRPLAAELRDYFRKNPELHARPDHWFGLLTGQLRREVALAWEQSELAAAHGIPPAQLAARAGDAAPSDPLRAFLDDGFVALLCRQCTAPHRRTALTPLEIRRRYATWFFDGDVRVAQSADPVRWQLLDEAIAYLAGGARASEG